MHVETHSEKLTIKDFATDQEVRWCPGCGDYAILKAVQKTLVDIDAQPENTVFVSGIGCAARFPYYIETYGFHTIHGRAPTFATGVKLANPKLDVWVVSGDGDALSIGGNHLVHMLRRNVNLQFLLFNNEIYGLTKGQYSPTSRAGTRSPSTPLGSVDNPISATQLALASGGRFVARSIDNQIKHMPIVLARAYAHVGTSFVEIFQNCIVYNDGVFSDFTAKDKVANQQISVEHGKPLLFGKDKQNGLYIKPGSFEIEVVMIGENGITEDDILVHDEKNKVLASLLADMQGPYFPVAIGVLYCDPAPSYEQEVQAVLEGASSEMGGDLNALIRKGHTWQVGAKL
jgi:2-oxoglutarate ferredoxin oxidoreductase subunit beta